MEKPKHRVMQVELLPLSAIHPNPNNPRVIKDDKFKKLVKSIQEFPQMLKLRPIVIDEAGMVLGGNMRLKALQSIGAKETYVVRAESLTQAQKSEFIAKDNIGFGEWDWDIIANEWDTDQLAEWGLDIPVFSGREAVEDNYEIPDEIETAIKRGDIIEIGQHRLMCGDSTSAEDVTKLMQGEKADMVFTDPPYGMFLNTDWSSAKSSLSFAKEKNALGGKKHRQVIGDHSDFRPELITTVFENFSYCKEIFLWGADYYADLLKDKNEGSWIVWDKRLDESADKMYGSCFELCWSKAKHKRMIARVKWAGIFGTEKEFDHKRHHPTQKPIALVLWFFDYYSLQNKNIVADLFLGSGTTMVAAHQLNRKCYGMEIEPKYCQIIIDRMSKLDPDLEVKINGIAIKTEYAI